VVGRWVDISLPDARPARRARRKSYWGYRFENNPGRPANTIFCNGRRGAGASPGSPPAT